MKHLLFTVLDYPNDTNHPVVSAFCDAQISNVDNFDLLDNATIKLLTYKEKDNKNPSQYTVKQLPISMKANLVYASRYVQLIVVEHEVRHGTYPPLSHFKTLTWESFNLYKSSPKPPPTCTAISTTPPNVILLADFKKSIKRDTAVYSK